MLGNPIGKLLRFPGPGKRVKMGSCQLPCHIQPFRIKFIITALPGNCQVLESDQSRENSLGWVVWLLRKDLKNEMKLTVV